MKFVKVRLNTYRNAAIAFSVSVIVLTLLFFSLGQKGTWAIWNVPTMTPHFADLRTITGGAESYSQGLDPMAQNPGDPWGRTMNYPRIWQSLFFLGINETDTTAFGLFIIALFLLGAILLLPNANILTTLFVLAAVLSPATLLGIERGNIDLLIFFLVVISVVLTAKTRLLSFATLLAAFFLKLYPVFGFIILLRERKDLLTKYAFGLFLILLAYIYFFYSDLILISSGTPRSTSLSYGMNVFWMKVASFNSAWGWIARIGSYIIIIMVIMLSLGALLQKDHAFNSEPQSGISLDAFRAGAGIYTGTFLLGNNWDYRLMFLILVIPQLIAWLKSNSTGIKLASWVTLMAIFISLWHLVWEDFFDVIPYGNLASYIIDETANWVAFGGTTFLLFSSVPSWLSAVAVNTINLARK